MTARTGGIPRYRPWEGPAVLTAGFRPFFLLAGISALVAVSLWLAILGGHVVLPTAFDPVTWHAHEMLFGFVQAAMAGFLLTAVPNWTGRMPIQGWSLGALTLLFVAGRIAVGMSESIGPAAAAAVDLSFPLALLAALAREIASGRNWRNLPVLGALALFTAANGLTHLESTDYAATADMGLRLAVAVVVALIGLIGGRIIPSFTRNWLAARGALSLPAPFGLFDKVAMLVTALALLGWAFAPAWTAVPLLLALAAAANLARLLRWQGHRTLRDPLLWVLHAGFLWVPVGLGLLAWASVQPEIAPSAALHALTGGAMATMILAISTRATLGHTGRPLRGDGRTALIFTLAIVSALARVAAGFSDGIYMPLLHLSGAAWIAAFALFLGVYGPMLVGPSPASRAGGTPGR